MTDNYNKTMQTNNKSTEGKDPQQIKDESSLDDASCSALFVVLAFRYGGHSNTFPIGVFTDREKAEKAAKNHRLYRGCKYDHRIYEFAPNKWDDDIGHAGNNKPCIEAHAGHDTRQQQNNQEGKTS